MNKYSICKFKIDIETYKKYISKNDLNCEDILKNAWGIKIFQSSSIIETIEKFTTKYIRDKYINCDCPYFEKYILFNNEDKIIKMFAISIADPREIAKTLYNDIYSICIDDEFIYNANNEGIQTYAWDEMNYTPEIKEKVYIEVSDELSRRIKKEQKTILNKIKNNIVGRLKNKTINTMIDLDIFLRNTPFISMFDDVEEFRKKIENILIPTEQGIYCTIEDTIDCNYECKLQASFFIKKVSVESIKKCHIDQFLKLKIENLRIDAWEKKTRL